MKFRSFCSGIGAPETAWAPLGWRCLSTAEIDLQASAVLAHHHTAPNLGDMTTCKDAIRDDADLFVAGTPCQSFSVAGLRKGLDDPRGNLALVFLGLVDSARPRWVVWENVPGVLSSGGGRDFGAFLGGMAELGYGWAYRVLDAQYVRVESHARAVPQRRRRVFVVGHLGDWRRAAAVLLERQGLCGNTPPRREAGQGVATALTRGLGSGGADDNRAQGNWHVPDISPAMKARDCKGPSSDGDGGSHADSKPHIAHGSVVRRLTPLECERLQGFPDNYTAVPWKGKPMADGPRYRMLGNSMAVNVMRWIGERIDFVNTLEANP